MSGLVTHILLHGVRGQTGRAVEQSPPNQVVRPTDRNQLDRSGSFDVRFKNQGSIGIHIPIDVDIRNR